MGIFGGATKKKNKNILKLVQNNNIQNLREKIKVLIVDDEDFDIVDRLKERKYNIYYKKDINYIIEASPFDIIILDIKGIAKNMDSPMEGFSIALKIKENFPDKSVHCYSSASLLQEIAAKIHEIDGYISKDTDTDKWAEILDSIIKKYVDVNYQWEALKKQLTNHGIPEDDIQEIEKEFKNIPANFSLDSFYAIITKKISSIQLLTNVLDIVFKFITILEIT